MTAGIIKVRPLVDGRTRRHGACTSMTIVASDARTRNGPRSLWLTALLTLAASAPIVFASAGAVRASGDEVPLWQRTSYRERGFDRSFKCDLIESQSLAPQVVVFGGSRALRMPPAEITRRTGLSAFNAAFHNGRPTDWWAVANYLVDRQPASPPRCVFCVQATSFASSAMHQGLILDERLSKYFPATLIAAKTDWALAQGVHDLLKGRIYSRYGTVLWNRYDARFAAGATLREVLDAYLDADMLATAGNGKIPRATRDMRYFEKTLAYLNAHGVKPLVVIMPYHPRVLKAFYAAGWGVKQRWLTRYLESLADEYEIRVLDCLRIAAWGGRASGFYDGSHITLENSRILIRYCTRKAPGCFRLHLGWVTPTPSETASPSPSALASGPAT